MKARTRLIGFFWGNNVLTARARLATSRALEAAKHCLLGICTLVVLVGCSQHNRELQERVTYWKTELTSSVPKGTPKENILQWGHGRQIRFEYLEKQHWLYANVEHQADAGSGFPCSGWNIILVVILDEHGRSIRNEIHPVGACI
jgi:hypothetical protein